MTPAVRKGSDNLSTGEKGGQIMKVKTNLKAGGTSLNHNETLVRDTAN